MRSDIHPWGTDVIGRYAVTFAFHFSNRTGETVEEVEFENSTKLLVFQKCLPN